MAAQRAVLVIEPALGVREMLRIVLEGDGYSVQTASGATTGLQLLRDSPAPMIVLFDVAPLPHLSRERSGLALLDAVAEDSPDGDQLARHGYVLMSTISVQALAGVERVPASLQILPKPFRLDDLRASLEQVDEWLRTHSSSEAIASMGGLGRAHLSIEASRRFIREALARLERDTQFPALSEE